LSPRLHFTFGPVQEFVSEARKTADLWTGSYLISYLAAHAINGALKAGANEEDFFPRIPDNPLLEAVRNPLERPTDSTHQAASVGTLPNRFSVRVGSSDQGKSFALAAKIGLDSAWRNVSNSCWQYLAKHVPLEAGIWERQIGNLWETSWTVSDDPRALSERKLMRAFEPVKEPGRKCTVCGRREELGNNAFRRPLSQKLGAGFLGDKERPCAVCLIKRTLPKVGREAFGWEVLGESFPSTPDLASDPWKRMATVNREARETREALATAAGKPFDQLEGGYFYPSYHEELVQSSGPKELLGRRLSALYRLAGVPRPTYAILAMDGDNMGSRLSRLDDSGRLELSKLILDFSLRVRDEVEDGASASRLVYAGGEDVLALLPMDRALDTAWKVRELYRKVFGEFDKDYRERLSDQPSTISAGLLYCPMTLSLRAALREAHRLLDEEAKDSAGRDALAIGAWKGGGEVLTFTRKWDQGQWIEELLKMAGKEESPYPSRFLYQAREIVRSSADNLDFESLKNLLALEYYGSREERFGVEDMEQARKRIAPLVKMSRKDGRLDPALFRLMRFFFEGT
jgi:CRISPR-associated protein Cmr2